MRRIVCATLLAGAVWPGVLAAQEKDLARAGRVEVMAHIRANGIDEEGLAAATEVLTQLRGPASRAELDAFADELVAVIVAGEDWRDLVDPTILNAREALFLAANPEQEGALPYQGAYDAMMRAVEQRRAHGKTASFEVYELVRIDPQRSVEFVNHLLRLGDDDSCSAFGRIRRDHPELSIEDGLRPDYLLDFCAANTSPRRTRWFSEWPRGSARVSSLVGFGVYYGEGWQAHYVEDRPRPVIRSVIRCTPAHYEGLRDGDVLLAINGRDAREDIPARVTFRGNPPEFGPPGGEATVRAEPPGEPGTEYVLTVERNGAVMEFTVVSVDQRARREIDSYLTEATGTPVQEGCPATPPWG